MKQLFLCTACLLILSLQVTEAKTLEVTYAVHFGLLGKLGIAHAKLTTQKQHYRIEIEARATGFAKTLSHNRHEKHISTGYIRNGHFMAESYEVIKSYGSKYHYKHYRIDHKKKKVYKSFYSKKNGKVIKKGEKVLNFFATNDLLTLYFNISRLITHKNKPGNYRFHAVGAERQKGLVEIILPDKKALKYYKEALGEGTYWYLTAIIYQKIFSSNRGELMLAVDKDGITQKAILKDLIMFGDLVAERIK